MKGVKRFRSIRTQVYICSFIMISIGAFVCSFGTFWAVRSNILEKSKMDYKLLTNNVSSTINGYMKDIIHYSELMITDREINNYLQKTYDTKKDYSYFLAQAQIEDKMKNLAAMGNQLFKNIMLVDRNGAVILYDDLGEAYLVKEGGYEAYHRSNGFVEEDGRFFYICSIAGNSMDESIGTLLFEIKPEAVLAPMTMVNGENLYLVLLDQEGNCITENMKEGEDFEFIIQQSLDSSGWSMVAKINKHILEQSLFDVGRLVMFLLFVVLVISYLILKPTLKMITDPLTLLTLKIKNFDIDDEKTLEVPSSNDEVGMIAEEYQKMVLRVKCLVLRLRKQKQTEVDLYMAQVNPHFIYNTLYALICVAEKKKDTEMADKIKNVANILCFSLYNTLDSYHTIAEEIQYIDQYIDILRYKYGDDLKVNWILNEDIKNERIGILLLYPIVENAVFHGLSQEGPKEISVIFERNVREIIISVKDNGAGMSYEKIYEIQSRLEQYLLEIQGGENSMEIDKAHMGLFNLKLRLYFLYGKTADVKIKSIVGQGTEVIINIKTPEN